jgi:hypothetical protein
MKNKMSPGTLTSLLPGAAARAFLVNSDLERPR